MAGIARLITGSDGGAEKRATERAAELQKQQEAVQARAQITQDNRAQDLSSQDAAQRRAIAARRRGGGSLAFTGASTALKSTLGG